MKHYLHRLHRIHQKDIKVKRGDDIEMYFEWVLQIANTFTRDAIAIGALNFMDLYQAGYVGLVEAYNKLDHDRGQAEKWTYLKKRIKWAIRREIDNHGAFIKVPRRDIEEQRANLSGINKELVNIFPQFFDEEVGFTDQGIERWSNVLLGELIDDLLLKYIKEPKHRIIISLCFGLDCEKQSIKDIANRFNMSEIGIKKIRERSINKLRNEDVEKIIENFYEN